MLIKCESKGPGFYVSNRVGKNNKIFKMFKFRTMRVNTPEVATHKLINASNYVTPLGRFLRKYSIDEIPQLINVVFGHMSFVGPRPALYNQLDLIALRTQNGVHTLVPGITGIAQINGRDTLSIEDKVAFDVEYLNKSAFQDLRIVVLTIKKIFSGDGVSH
jgi:O-antigen biosynthesis protein WbqP